MISKAQLTGGFTLFHSALWSRWPNKKCLQRLSETAYMQSPAVLDPSADSSIAYLKSSCTEGSVASWSASDCQEVF